MGGWGGGGHWGQRQKRWGRVSGGVSHSGGGWKGEGSGGKGGGG